MAYNVYNSSTNEFSGSVPIQSICDDKGNNVVLLIEVINLLAADLRAISSMERCQHSSRYRVQGKSTTCVMCQCEKITEILSSSTEMEMSTVYVNNVNHVLKTIVSVLEAQPSTVMYSDGILRPIIDCLMKLFKLNVVEMQELACEGAAKVCVRGSTDIRSYFLFRLIEEIRNDLREGYLSCLKSILEFPMYCESFLRKYGNEIMPKIFFMVGTLRKENGDTKSWEKINSIYGIMERLMRVGWKTGTQQHGSLRSTNECQNVHMELGDSNVPLCLSLFLPHASKLTLESIKLMKACQFPPLLENVMKFLTSLFQNEETLSAAISSQNGIALCTMLKKMLFTHNTTLQIEALTVLKTMMNGHLTCTQEDEAITAIPNLILQSDLLHFVTQTLATSNIELFNSVVYLLNQLSQVPVFKKGKMLSALEACLRISSMIVTDPNLNVKLMNVFYSNVLKDMPIIPYGIQRQILTLYGKLSSNLDSKTRLAWAQLLLYCTDKRVRSSMLNIFEALSGNSRESLLENNVVKMSPLKLLLTIGQAVISCEVDDDADEGTIVRSELNLLSSVMSPDHLPAIKALIEQELESDCQYVITLLKLCLNYPQQLLSPSQQLYLVTTTSVKVFNDSIDESSRTSSKCKGFSKLHTVKVPTHVLSDVMKVNPNENEEGNCFWTSHVYLAVLSSIRSSLKFMSNNIICELWNQNFVRVVMHSYKEHLPQLHHIWEQAQKLNMLRNADDFENETWKSSVLHKAYRDLSRDIFEWDKYMTSSQCEGSCPFEKKMRRDCVLLFYFFHYLYVGDSLPAASSQRFIISLQEFLENLAKFKNAKSLSNHSFYLKLILLITSYVPKRILGPLSDSLKKSLQRYLKHGGCIQEIMTWRAPVLRFIMEENICTPVLLAKVLEKWLDCNKEEFLWFYASKSNEENSSQQYQIANSLLSIIAYGTKNNSAIALELRKSQRTNQSVLSETTMLQEIIAEQIESLLLCDDLRYCSRFSADSTCDDFSGQRHQQETTNPINFAHMIELAVEEELFLRNIMPTSEFIDGLILILIRYQNTEKVTGACLKLICQLSNNDSCEDTVKETLFGNPEFLKFLGERLSLLENGDINLTHLVFDIFACLLQLNSGATKSFPDEDKIIWNLSSIFSSIQYVWTHVAFLKFLYAVLHVKLDTPLLKIEEASWSAFEVSKLYMQLLFHVENLFFKVADPECEKWLWKIMGEIFSTLEDKGRSDSKSIRNVILHHWLLFLIGGKVLIAANWSQLSSECLHFLKIWTHLCTKMICGNSSVLKWEITQAQYSFSRKNIFEQLKNLLSLKDGTIDFPRHHNTGRSEDANTRELKKQQLRGEIAGSCVLLLSALST